MLILVYDLRAQNIYCVNSLLRGGESYFKRLISVNLGVKWIQLLGHCLIEGSFLDSSVAESCHIKTALHIIPLIKISWWFLFF